MFTGIITDIGELAERAGGRFTIRCSYAAAGHRHRRLDRLRRGLPDGDHGRRRRGAAALFTVDVSNETLSKTTLGDWRPGQRINLERALKAGDELGGHIVSGHVDGVARIVDIRPDGESRRFTVEVPAGPCPLHRVQGLGGAGRHLAHRQRRGSKPASASTSSRTP